MKIGIFTFHSQLNYGGVLQCWALKEALRRMGHKVVVIDRWLDEDNATLKGPFARFSLRRWLGLVIRGMFGCGQFAPLLRHIRTMCFVKKLGLTPYHFYDWKDAPKDLGVDCLVVGSDQVWHGGDWGDPRPYLLEGAPQIPAIAYAASFGMKELPQGIDYRSGFARFKVISVREAGGIGLIKGMGYAGEVMHVVDPTLLLPREGWKRMGEWRKVSRRMVCYLLSENIEEAMPVLEDWARRNNGSVEILCNTYLKSFPKSFKAVLRRAGDVVRGCFKPHRVRVRTDYGPREFSRAFARAEMVVTDSFHAVMFSSIYGCNIRFISPRSEFRRTMFARVEEFATSAMDGEVFVKDLPSALQSFDRGERVAFCQDAIARRRQGSEAWLRRALDMKSEI